MATKQDTDAVAAMFATLATLGGNHAYRAAKATYRRTWGAERARKAQVRAVEAERARRYAALGITPRDIFTD